MIRTYSKDGALNRLVRREDGSENYAPGDMVGWLRDGNAMGTVIGVNEDENHDLVEVAVLWSRAPRIRQVTSGSISSGGNYDLTGPGPQVPGDIQWE